MGILGPQSLLLTVMGKKTRQTDSHRGNFNQHQRSTVPRLEKHFLGGCVDADVDMELLSQQHF